MHPHVMYNGVAVNLMQLVQIDDAAYGKITTLNLL